MNIQGTIIRCRSFPAFYEKERNGNKPNTVRKLEYTNSKVLKNMKIIEVMNTHTGETFQRKITDISFWDMFVIISWRHE